MRLAFHTFFVTNCFSHSVTLLAIVIECAYLPVQWKDGIMQSD